MCDQVQLFTPAITIHLRRSPRAKRFLLRVSNVDGRISLTLPRHGSRRQALAFATGQEVWLRKAMARHQPPTLPRFGQPCLLDGVAHVLTPTTGRRVQARQGHLLVPGNAQTLAPRLQAFLKLHARDRLSVATTEFANRVGKPVAGISLRDTRSRWGSCSSAGRLMFSWRLAMAPPETLRYVAAHEVAHLAEMNHSPAFWRIVGDLMPEFQVQRDWLRCHGPDLHRLQFQPEKGGC